MDFSVTILGSGSAVPTGLRNPTSQYVVCGGRHILIDCGEGTQMQIRRFGIKFQKIDYIFISHLHGDHYFGLVGLLSTMHLMGRNREVRIFGPEGLEKIVRSQLEIGGRLGFSIHVEEHKENTTKILFEDAKMMVSCFPLKHSIPTTGYLVCQKEKERKLLIEKAQEDGVKIAHYHRLKKGEDVVDEDTGVNYCSHDYTVAGMPEKKYAFCSDTAYNEEVIPHIEGVDLLYHEATFTNDMISRAKATRHSTAKQAATIAQMAGAKRLLIGHFSARYPSAEKHLEEAQEVFQRVQSAEEGEVYTIR